MAKINVKRIGKGNSQASKRARVSALIQKYVSKAVELTSVYRYIPLFEDVLDIDVNKANGIEFLNEFARENDVIIDGHTYMAGDYEFHIEWEQDGNITIYQVWVVVVLGLVDIIKEKINHFAETIKMMVGKVVASVRELLTWDAIEDGFGNSLLRETGTDFPQWVMVQA